MADEFIVDSHTAHAIQVHHKPSAHRFTFNVFDQINLQSRRKSGVKIKFGGYRVQLRRHRCGRRAEDRSA